MVGQFSPRQMWYPSIKLAGVHAHVNPRSLRLKVRGKQACTDTTRENFVPAMPGNVCRIDYPDTFLQTGDRVVRGRRYLRLREMESTQ